MALLTSELGVNVDFDIPLSHFGFDDTNLVSNPEFVTAGAGDPDFFASWTENAGSYATIARTAIAAEWLAIAGEYACKFTTTGTDPTGAWDGYIYQDVTVSPTESYKLSFASIVGGQGTTSSQGRFAVYDQTNSAWIITKRNTGLFSSQNWARTSIYVNAPAGCSTMRIYLYQNITTGVATDDEDVYFGKIILQKRTQITRAPIPAWGGSGNLGSYRHTIAVNIGYDNMQLTTTGGNDYIGDWLENGLGRRVVATYGGTIIWEGFVNEVSARLGSSTITVGPLVGVVNRGSMVYKGVDFSVTPAITVPGGAVKSQWYDNNDSQGKYGVFEGKITGGEGLADEMTQLLQTIVETTSWPELSQNINIGSSTELAVTVSCLGYGHMLDKFFYTQTALAGSYNISQKILDVISVDPNNIFSIFNTDVAVNTSQVEKYEDTDRTALAILKDLASQGDSDYNRYVFGVFANRKLSYWNVTDRETRYYMSIASNRISTADRALQQPWEILPGEWLNIIDIIPGRPAISKDFRSDPKMLFIESVTYTAPYTVSLSGGRASTFKQKIESLGLGGF
jgi:hypothetical protein